MDSLLFEYNLARTRLESKARQIARAVLVDGMTQVEAARRWHVSQPRVAAICRKIREAPDRRNEPPKLPTKRGLKFAGGWVGPDAADKIRAIIRQARADAARAAKAAAAAQQEASETFSGEEIVSPDD